MPILCDWALAALTDPTAAAPVCAAAWRLWAAAAGTSADGAPPTTLRPDRPDAAALLAAAMPRLARTMAPPTETRPGALTDGPSPTDVLSAGHALAVLDGTLYHPLTLGAC
jgi:hypothetical protein